MLICPQCNLELPDDLFFCTRCGTSLEAAASRKNLSPQEELDSPENLPDSGETPAKNTSLPWEKKSAPQNTEIQQAPGIFLCQDGKLRWTYDLSLWKNPTVLFTLLKILGGIAVGISLFMFFITLGDGLSQALNLFWPFLLYSLLAALIFSLVGYSLYALIQGGKYCVVFEMDKKGVRHIQMEKNFQKAQVLAMIGILTGVAAGNPTTAGSNLLAFSRQSSYSSFSDVTKILGKPSRGVIYVNQGLFHNQIYVTDAQYDFVLEYIQKHVVKGNEKKNEK